MRRAYPYTFNYINLVAFHPFNAEYEIINQLGVNTDYNEKQKQKADESLQF